MKKGTIFEAYPRGKKSQEVMYINDFPTTHSYDYDCLTSEGFHIGIMKDEVGEIMYIMNDI